MDNFSINDGQPIKTVNYGAIKNLNSVVSPNTQLNQC